ncbi:uncharacterized protein LOC117562228 [Gymnodraco acuticeps]|uniref:Uncharacterized protein LOC117562228 n=1 Tax=Gymnodraco acuticeps TaxID=8218 RepID=A0A6P8WFA1_GYMAC|nr:uncharacterized protein LOC117562228 [Gymnodraco acuticeps]
MKVFKKKGGTAGRNLGLIMLAMDKKSPGFNTYHDMNKYSSTPVAHNSRTTNLQQHPQEGFNRYQIAEKEQHAKQREHAMNLVKRAQLVQQLADMDTLATSCMETSLDSSFTNYSDPDFVPDSTAEDSSELEEDIPLTPKKPLPSLQHPPLSPAKPNCSSKKNNWDTQRKRKITSPSPLKKNSNTHNKKSRIDEDSIRVLPPSNSESRRVYNKRNYCLYCFHPTAKIARHLEAVHGKVPDAAIAF